MSVIVNSENTCISCGNVTRCPLCGFDQDDGNCYVVPEAVCLHQDRLDYRERWLRFADVWVAIGLAATLIKMNKIFDCDNDEGGCATCYIEDVVNTMRKAML